LAAAGPDDVAAVTRLFGALHRYNASLDLAFALADGWEALLRDHFLRTHDDQGALWLLAWLCREGGGRFCEPVGLLLVEAHRDSPLFRERSWAELVALYVAPERPGSGLATHLLDEAKMWASARGFDRLQLYVTATNLRARAFYRRSGLRPTQEIWRMELIASGSETPPGDPSCAEGARDGAELLEQGHHHLANERPQDVAHEPAPNPTHERASA
jgi:ribosomal protein S18 acetylase RimI-like enzyme